ENKLLRSKLLDAEDLARNPPAVAVLRRELLEEIEKSSSILSAEQVSLATTEIEEIRKRKLNLIISGLPEHNADDIVNFLKFANNHHYLPSPLTREAISGAERVGKPGPATRPRLLRLKFATQSVRRQTLIMHRNIKPGDYPL